MCDKCHDLQSQVDQLRDDLMLVARSEKRWSDKFCSRCNERATNHRFYQYDLEPGNIAVWAGGSIPLCAVHAVEWDEDQAAKEEDNS